MEIFRRMLACFIVITNVPLRIIDEWAFQQLFLHWLPDITFPGRRGIRNLIMKEFKSEKERIINFFKTNPELKV